MHRRAQENGCATPNEVTSLCKYYDDSLIRGVCRGVQLNEWHQKQSVFTFTFIYWRKYYIQICISDVTLKK